jgi:hypothetical protein
MVFGKKVIQHKMCFDFIYKFCLKHVILRRIQTDIINVYWSSCKVPVFLVRFSPSKHPRDRVSKNTQISNFVKISQLGAELFHSEGQP